MAQLPEYAKINGGDQADVRGDDVGTAASESLMGHQQKNWEERQVAESTRWGRWRRCISAIFSLQGLLNTLLLFVILGLLVDRRWHKQRHGHFEGNGDITGYAPQCESIPSLANKGDCSSGRSRLLV